MFEDEKYQVAVATRMLSEVGLASGATASLGHISMRVPGSPDRFVVKGRGYAVDVLSRMRPSDMVVCDLDGFLVEAPPGIMQCFEVKLHSCIYRTRPDVESVVHVHPRFTVLMGVLQPRLRPMCIEGYDLVKDPLPVFWHFRLVQSDSEGMELVGVLGQSRATLMIGHGATAVGGSMDEAFVTMLNLEEQARMNYHAYAAAGPGHPGIPDRLLDEPWADRAELPHFRDSETVLGRPRRPNGVWTHYYELAEAAMNAR